MDHKTFKTFFSCLNYNTCKLSFTTNHHLSKIHDSTKSSHFYYEQITHFFKGIAAPYKFAKNPSFHLSIKISLTNFSHTSPKPLSHKIPFRLLFTSYQYFRISSLLCVHRSFIDDFPFHNISQYLLPTDPCASKYYISSCAMHMYTCKGRIQHTTNSGTHHIPPP